VRKIEKESGGEVQELSVSRIEKKSGGEVQEASVQKVESEAETAKMRTDKAVLCEVNLSFANVVDSEAKPHRTARACPD
jgi:hypothetical protein